MTLATMWIDHHDHPMILWLAQIQAPDAGEWTITTFIALAGAVISLATLIVTTVSSSKREDRKWARDALSQAFYDFTDAGFKTRDVAQEYQELVWAGADKETLIRAKEAMKAQKDLLRHAQTKVRLLAPKPAFEQAKDLRQSIRKLVNAVNSKDLTKEAFDQLTDTIEQEREKFLTLAKKAMALPR